MISTNVGSSNRLTWVAHELKTYKSKYCKGEMFWRLVLEGFDDGTDKEDSDTDLQFANWQDFKEKIVDTKLYEVNGTMGKYKSLYNEVQYWKRERAKILNKINDLSEQFYKKYEPYIKEGTFSDSNYLTDNEYYWTGVQVLDDSCKPQVSYNISVIDISPLEEYADDYTFELADTTYIEDIDFFGINSKTGLPNREKVLISAIDYDLDQPKNNSITVQNYTSQFEDLFSSITASVQSLSFNENIYKRASNFTAKQYIETDSLQDTLDIGDLTLLDTAKDNIVLDENGAEGNNINNSSSQYKLSGEGLYFSTDGGTTWDYGVGPGGINLDYAKFGSLDSSKIQIMDSDYIYFLWDKDGINAYRDPSTSTEGLVDFARFNRYGLSLIENNNIRLRAGYEYRSNATGNNITGAYDKELDLSDQNIGFYLYNDSGQPIFKTETRSSYADSEDTDYTARLSLTGEIFVTNKVLDSADLSSSSGSTVAQLSCQYILNYESTYTYSEVDETKAMKYMLQNDSDYVLVDGGGNLYSQITVNSSSTTTYTLYYKYKFNTVAEGEVDYIFLYNYNGVLITATDETKISAEKVYGIINGTASDDSINVSYSSSSSKKRNYCVQSGDNLGKMAVSTTGENLILSGIYESATLDITNSNLTPKTITYLANGVSTSTELYVYTSGNQTTYWKNLTSDYGLTSTTSNSDYYASEIGIYINNKKALHAGESGYEDRTDTGD
jgi:hypothetical protein